VVDLYATLGLSKGATTAEIKAAYRKKAKESHPDKGGDPEVFTQLSIAYSTLKDEESRAYYDATGKQRSTSIDPVHGHAVSIIATVFSRFAERDDMLSIDLPGMIIAEIEAMVRKSQNIYDNGMAEVARLGKARNKLRRKKKQAPDYIVQMIDGRIAMLQVPLAEAKFQLDATKRARELLDVGYEFDADPAPPKDDNYVMRGNPPASVEELLRMMDEAAKGGGKKKGADPFYKVFPT
jgi:hypothetical protein